MNSGWIMVRTYPAMFVLLMLCSLGDCVGPEPGLIVTLNDTQVLYAANPNWYVKFHSAMQL